ncbi:phosphotransferase family protein [Alteribacter natronophilus]|uniref:phosphotransferase family protein n=1 Tax=Alteribacter natronophilus TaxID=2583810 RepID=UPI00110E1452|nr:phosphotransferase family protein [Alteribacter natronophilus]
MKHLIGEGWHLRPAGGATGEAYVAEQGEQKIFIKRNSSPFLAVLSAEGIVPKLLWTKRLESGDVITAQRWVNGRELKSFDMNDARIARLLGKIHRSKELLEMFRRLGNTPLTPERLLYGLKEQAGPALKSDHAVTEAMVWLEEHIGEVQTDHYVVCHSDVNHNNWIISEEDALYLIDWDGANVADPALDLSALLYLYVPEEDWKSWLDSYGVTLTPDLVKRMSWYMLAQSIESVVWHGGKGQTTEYTKWRTLLKEVLHKVNVGMN